MKQGLLLFYSLFFTVCSIQARGFVLDGVKYEIISTVSPYGVSVVPGIDYVGDVIIPSTVNYNDTVFSVTYISPFAFKESNGLITLAIPNSVTSIGVGAFLGCSSLLSINIEPTNQYFVFDDGILYDVNMSQIICCLQSKTSKVDIPETVRTIGTGAFQGCSAITSVTIPNTVTSIGSDAFLNCTGLLTVIIGDSTNTGHKNSIAIQSSAFIGCSSLSSLSLNLPLTPYYSPFRNLDSLETLVVGNSVPTIDSSIFSSLSGLTKVTLGRTNHDPVTISVSVGAFNGSVNLETLNLNANFEILNSVVGVASPFSNISNLSIGEKVTSIGQYAFFGAKKLKSVSIPNSVVSLGISAFADCTFMSDISLGSSIMQLGTLALSGCNSLLNINVDDANSKFSSVDGVLFTKDQAALIQYPLSRSGDYSIPAKVKTIEASAFQYSNGLKSVSIPQSITIIQSSAFANCTELISVSIGHGDSISSDAVAIASNAFTSCVSLKTLHLNKSFSFTGGDNSPFKNLSSIIVLQVGNGVASIPNYSFSGCTGLASVQLGQMNNASGNAITVASNAFSGCSNFKQLDLNRNVNVAGNQSAFSTITNLMVGEGVSFIGDQVFNQCVHLTTVELPASVTKIGNGAFQYCSKIRSITLPGVNNIGSHAFWGCSALTSISIPDAVKIIQTCTFYECTGLLSVSLSDSITQIASSAFYGCNNLSSIVIPDLVKSIDENAFKNCSALTTVTLGKSLASIGTYAFSGCAAFQSIQFPGTLTSIADNAFENCKGLISLSILSTIKTIGGNAFANCSSIVTLTIGEAGNPGSELNCSSFPFSGCTGVKTLILNKNIANDLYSSPFMSLTQVESVTISNRVTHLNTFAFYGCSKLTSVYIPNSVAAIGEAAFQGCTSLTDVKLPIGLNFLSNQIFYGCTNLKSIDIPSDVTFIGSRAFYQCSSLTSLTIPKTILLIGPLAFSGCTELKELVSSNPLPATTGIDCFVGINVAACKLYVPIDSRSAYQSADNWKVFANIDEKDIQDSVQNPDSISGFISKTITIDAGGLSDALTSTELATVNKLIIIGRISSTDLLKIRTMPALYILNMENATIERNTIASNAFSGIKNLLSITLPSTITSIGTGAFENCSGLIYVIFTSDNTSIGSSAFANCTGLMLVALPKSISSIKSSVFYGCSRLFAINIPSSVTTIEHNAFAKCTGFTTINLPNSITSIGEYAFAGCYGLRSFTIPPLMKIMSEGLFKDCYSLRSVHLPISLTTIVSGEVFASCRNLNSIYNYQTTPIVLTDFMIFYSLNLSTCVLYVPTGSLNAYREAPVWNSFLNIREMTNTDVNTKNLPTLSFYPNPVSEGFYVSGLTESGILTLTSLRGEVIFSSHVTNNDYVSISSLPTGVYIAKIANNNFSIERKILKR